MRFLLLLLLASCARTPAPVSPDGEEPGASLSPEEAERRRLVEQELAQGRATILATDLHDAPEAERTFVKHMLEAGERIEVLYMRQTGAWDLRERLPADHPPSAALFHRNQGPWCEAPATQDDPACSAIPGAPPRISGLYPADLQDDPALCAKLAAEHPEVMNPFVAAVREGDQLRAVPYSQRWPEDMAAVATSLRAAAAALDPEEEAALRTYLLAAADAFGTNDWFAADAAWAAMDQHNSAWYVRIGPDETYFDPCAEHAGFHMVLARVNPDGVAWQERLEPVKQDMEQALAALAGPPYPARTVGFDLPEFIDIVVNSGDSRSALGATIGQSLPNWGPVAEAGGRTVAMTNVLTDPESVASRSRSMSSVFCPATFTEWPAESGPQVYTTVLHEAAHNLGPSGEYAVDGQTDVQRFGGPLAATLEELKCEMAALYLAGWLAERGVTAPDTVLRARMGNLGWDMGKISEGMVDGAGNPRAYPQLAAIEVGYFLEHGGLRWEPDTLAANGTDRGCFEVDREVLPGAVEALTADVLRIKSTGDREAGEALRARYVEAPGELADLRATITERFGREPRPSIGYEVRFE